MSEAKKMLNIAGNVLFIALIAVLAVMVVFLVKGKLDGGDPSIAGYKLMTVLSGSMEPEFNTGSMIIVAPAEASAIAEGDVITFKSADPVTEEELVITHRVLQVTKQDGNLAFKTKGDANNAEDDNLVPASKLIGREIIDIPNAGYVTEFAKSKNGLIFMIVIPGLFIIGVELRNLWKYISDYEKEQENRGNITTATASNE